MKNKNYKYERKRINNSKVNKSSEVEVISFDIQIPKFNAVIGNEYVENGKNNSVYEFIDECYNESPTNSAIINGVANYIIADGLYDTNGYDLTQHIDNEDVELICLDFKKYGSYAIQILWNLDKKIQYVKYLNVKKVLLKIDDEGEITSYGYSFDLKNKSKFPIKWFPKFDGNFKENEDEKFYSEILVVQRPSSNDFFANCDYQPALQYAKLEQSLAKSSISFSNNSFRGTTIVNLNGAVPPTDELKKQYRDKIVEKLSGSDNTGSIIVSFNENSEQTMTVEHIPLPELSETLSVLSEEAQMKLIMCHQVPPVLFYGMRSSSNLGTNRDEILTSTKSLYLRSVNPMRNTILNGLGKVFKHIDPNIQLKFKDFDWLKEEDKEDKNDINNG